MFRKQPPLDIKVEPRARIAKLGLDLWKAKNRHVNVPSFGL